MDIRLPSSFFFLFLCVALCVAAAAADRKVLQAPQKVAGVNLGGWLVVEGWMTPSLFEHIPDPDLLDGSTIQLKSTAFQTYVSAEGGGGQNVVVNRAQASGWETFTILRYSDGAFKLRAHGNQFVGISSMNSDVQATATTPDDWERFTFIRSLNNKNRVHIQAYNGMYLQAKEQSQLTADFVASSSEDIGWDDNAATFELIITSSSPYKGEYQLANGYGPEWASGVFKQHRESFITESDFEYLNGIGINLVRIPVGYWIANDPNPPEPFVSGSLQALDNAFDWARIHNIKILIDLHAAPGSQNGEVHSATIDGAAEWATRSDYIDETLNVIDFLASRYTTRPELYGIELLNEPQAKFVSHDILKSYYKRGYDIVRKYDSNTYVVICELLGVDAHDSVVLGDGFRNAILDLHYYNKFGSPFDKFSPQENIDYVKNTRREEIESLNRNVNGLLTFIGEWANEWEYNGATESDYRAFGQAQLQVYGEATAGWAFWNYKTNESYLLNWNFRESYEQQRLVKPAGGWNP